MALDRAAQAGRVDAELAGEAVQRIAALEVSGFQQAPQVAAAGINDAQSVFFDERRVADQITGNRRRRCVGVEHAFDKVVIRDGFVDEALAARVHRDQARLGAVEQQVRVKALAAVRARA